MKSILKSLIAIFILGIIATGFTPKPNNSKQFIIQSTDNSISMADLSLSAGIITNRLKSFSSEKFEVSTIAGKNQIKVILGKNWDINLAENLITQKGVLEFYETCNYKEVTELLKGDSIPASLFGNNVPAESSAQIGCTSSEGVAQADKFMNALGLDQKCKFAWSSVFEDPEVCLYALKLNNGEGVICKGDDIESFVSGNETGSKENYISFSFKKQAVQLWAEITKRNSGKAIAMVLDGKVIFAPAVMDEITSGKCTLTGGFTAVQMNYIAAICANGELPVSFKVVN
jgi:preprotein translocase subunit SecD